MCELVAAIALGLNGLLEPPDCLIGAAELHEVDANIVVWITKVRIDSDRLLAGGDGFLQLADIAE